MDLATVVGLISGFTFLILTIFIALNFQLQYLISYVDWPSVMCVVGGTSAAILIAFPLSQVIQTLKSFKVIIFPPLAGDTKAVIAQLIDLANVARKEGILALEEAAQSMDEKFLKKGLLLIVDGTEAELVRGILETELSYMETRHKTISDSWGFVASQGPAWGMLGTIIGLINMLNNMDDPSTLGPNMAVALLTTFYGSIIANYLALPTKQKMEFYTSEEVLMKELMIEGMLSIQAGENPRIIEEKLKSFLAPAQRDLPEAADGGGE